VLATAGLVRAEPVAVFAQLVALAVAAPLQWDRFESAHRLGSTSGTRDPWLETVDESLQGVSGDLYRGKIVLGDQSGEVRLGSLIVFHAE
jgi:hypothetical protein